MGYIVQILRTSNGVEKPIRPDEVRALAGKMGLKISQSSLADADMDVELEKSDGGGPWRLAVQKGRLWTSNPGNAELEAMLVVAGHLNARVRGDELETYRTATDTYFHKDDLAEKNKGEAATQALRSNYRRKQRLLNVAIILFFLTLASLVAFMSK